MPRVPPIPQDPWENLTAPRYDSLPPSLCVKENWILHWNQVGIWFSREPARNGGGGIPALLFWVMPDT